MKKIISSFLLFALSYSLGFAQKNVLVKVLGNKQLPEQGLEQGLSSSGKTAGLELLTPAAVRGVLGGHSVPGLAPGAGALAEEASFWVWDVEALSQTRVLPAGMLERQLRRAATARVKHNIAHSLVRVIAPDGSTASSGFIFEENWNGTPEYWIALSRHSVGLKGHHVVLQILTTDGLRYTFPATVTIGGRLGIGALDLSLVALPARLRSQVTALKWAKELPEIGENGSSFGFHSQQKDMADFMHIQGRRVQGICGYHLLTPFRFASATEASGACGGPLLNEKGEVLGIHSGSFMNKFSLAINRKGLNDLLRFYHTGVSLRPLLFRGQLVGQLNVNDKIDQVGIWRDGIILKNWNDKEKPPVFDATALEKLYDFRSGDRLQIHFEHEKEYVDHFVFIVP